MNGELHPVPRLDRTRPLVAEITAGTTVKIIGLGGVGGIVARYGAVFLASLQKELRLVLVDGDAFEPKNATRMLFSDHGNKAQVVKDDLLPYLEDSLLTVVSVAKFVTPENLDQLIQEDDIVVLCVDNHATRNLVNDFCVARRRNVCLISGGNDGVENGGGKSGNNKPARRGTYGNCQVLLRRDGENRTATLGEFHPEIAEPADHLPSDQDCVELAASVPQILFANLLAASCILNTLWLHLCGELHYCEVCFDVAEGLMRPVMGVRDPDPR